MILNSNKFGEVWIINKCLYNVVVAHQIICTFSQYLLLDFDQNLPGLPQQPICRLYSKCHALNKCSNTYIWHAYWNLMSFYTCSKCSHLPYEYLSIGYVDFNSFFSYYFFTNNYLCMWWCSHIQAVLLIYSCFGYHLHNTTVGISRTLEYYENTNSHILDSCWSHHNYTHVDTFWNCQYKIHILYCWHWFFLCQDHIFHCWCLEY